MQRLLRWAVMVLGLSTSLPAMAETIVLAADLYCPINCAPNSPQPGYAVEIVKAVFAPHGITVDYQILPWKRAIADGRAGTVDGIIGASNGKPGFVYPAEPVGLEKFVLLAPADSTWTYTGPASLAGRKVGVIEGYEIDGPFGRYVSQHLNDPKIIEPSSGAEAGLLNVKKLVNGRLDALIDNESVLKRQLAQLGLERKLRIAGTVTAPSPLFVVFSDRNPQAVRLAKIWDGGVAELRRTGQLARIMASYGLTDWK